MNGEDETTTTEAEAPRRHPVSLFRAAANVVLFVSAGLFALGWLNLVLNVGHWDEERLGRLAAIMAYVGFLAIVAFFASLVLILIENRVVPETKEDTP